MTNQRQNQIRHGAARQAAISSLEKQTRSLAHVERLAHDLLTVLVLSVFVDPERGPSEQFQRVVVAAQGAAAAVDAEAGCNGREGRDGDGEGCGFGEHHWGVSFA